MLNYIEKEAPFWSAPDRVETMNIVDSTLTVVSFNIKFALKLDEALEELSADPYHSADIILLQEMDEHGTIFLSEQLDYNYLYYPMSFSTKHSKNFGNAILSKWPIKQPEKILLPHTQPINKQNRGVTSAIIEYGDIDIKAYSIHLETPVMSRSKRIEQLITTLDHIESKENTEFVVAGGDFNSMFPKDVEKMVSLCQANNLDWSTECIGHTLSKFNILRPKLDHIFSKGFRLVDAGKTNGTIASDHYPIWTTLEVL